MDDRRFDSLARSLRAAPSRRSLLGLTLGGLLPALLVIPETSARKHKGKKKRKQPPQALTCPGGQQLCQGRCISSGQCCNDAGCTEGKTCQNGTCACTVGHPVCGTAAGEVCCTPQAGTTPYHIECLSLPDNTHACWCAFNVTGNCGPDCKASANLSLPCADAAALASACAQSGCPLCGANEALVGITCVSKQGTCATGANSCPGPAVACNNTAGCSCFQSTAGETRCGWAPVGIRCGQCTTDAHCRAFHSQAFCVTQTAPHTACGCATPGQGFCMAPC